MIRFLDGLAWAFATWVILRFGLDFNAPEYVWGAIFWLAFDIGDWVNRP